MNNPPLNDDGYVALVRNARLVRAARVTLFALGAAIALLLGYALAPAFGRLF
jgi:hypothetical protein